MQREVHYTARNSAKTILTLRAVHEASMAMVTLRPYLDDLRIHVRIWTLLSLSFAARDTLIGRATSARGAKKPQPRTVLYSRAAGADRLFLRPIGIYDFFLVSSSALACSCRCRSVTAHFLAFYFLRFVCIPPYLSFSIKELIRDMQCPDGDGN